MTGADRVRKQGGDDTDAINRRVRRTISGKGATPQQRRKPDLVQCEMRLYRCTQKGAAMATIKIASPIVVTTG